MGKDVIIACDFESAKETIGFLEKFGDKRPFVKIGMELFYAEGLEIVRVLKDRGHKVFLDLKLHDIPNTVRRTMRTLSKLGADIVNVHAGGTIAMMKAASEGACEGSKERPLIIAVTQLTSTDADAMHKELLIEKSIEEVVIHYAKNVKSAGLDGVVCSAKEASAIHKNCGLDFLTVTPGIRFEDSEHEDQKRVMTPKQAGKIGSDYIVVGRPITRADNPLKAYERAVKDFVY